MRTVGVDKRGGRSQTPAAEVVVALRPAGASLAAAGLLLGVFTPMHPSILGERSLATVVRETSMWTTIHLALVAVSVLAIFGAAGIVALHRGGLGRLGQVALPATIVGCVATAYVMFLEAVAMPIVADEAPQLLDPLLDRDGPVLSSPLLLACSAAALLFPLGFAALGLGVRRAQTHPVAGVALAVSAGAFIALEGPFVPVLGAASSVAFGSALMWWGWILWRGPL